MPPSQSRVSCNSIIYPSLQALDQKRRRTERLEKMQQESAFYAEIRGSRTRNAGRATKSYNSDEYYEAMGIGRLERS